MTEFVYTIIMLTTNLDQRVKRIARLSQEDVNRLEENEIRTEEELRFVGFEDFSVLISKVKRRKLDLICRFLANGESLDATTTMEQVQISVRNAEKNPGQTVAAPAIAPTVNQVDRFAPKVHTDPLPKFSGDPVDYEDWDRKAEATIQQTIYKYYLSRPAAEGNPMEEARSSELYYMLQSCVGEGHALNTLDKAKEANDGIACRYRAWKALKDWYMDPSQISTMVAHYEGKLDDLMLDNDSTATQFINSFELYVRKLEKLEAEWTDDKKCREFKDRVSDQSDYDTEVRTHSGDYDSLVRAIRKREQDLEKRSSAAKRKTRRYKALSPTPDSGKDDSDPEGDSGKKRLKPASYKVPFMPSFLFKSLDKTSRANLAKWRSLVNAGKEMVPEDLIRSNNGKVDGSKNPPHQ